MSKREHDRKVNIDNGILDIDNLPHNIKTEIRNMLRNLNIQDCYCGDVLQMLKVISQGIIEKRNFVAQIDKVVKEFVKELSNL